MAASRGASAPPPLRRLLAALLWHGVRGLAPNTAAEGMCDVEYQTRMVCGMGGSRPKSRKLAILVSTVFGRFYPATTMRRVVLPAIRAGYEVDYYAHLGAPMAEGAFNAWWYRGVADSLSNLTKPQLEEYVIRRARYYGIRRVAIRFDHVLRLDPYPEDPSWSRWIGTGGRDSNKLYRILLHEHSKEVLWNWTQELGYGPYHQYLAIRGDIHWVDDFRIQDLSDPWAIYTRPWGHLCHKPPYADVPDDRVILVGGNVAGKFLTAYSAYYHHPSAELNTPQRIEEFLYKIAAVHGIPWRITRQGLFPYFPILHIQQPGAERPIFCLRGIQRKALFDHPGAECVNPGLIHHPFCEDFELL